MRFIKALQSRLNARSLWLPALLCAMLLRLPSIAQQHNYKKFDLVDGLPATFVYRVVQDDQSYLWFATDNGVSRYDGTSFKNFTSQNGFPDYGAFHLEKDSKGKMWFLPFNGKICYYEDGRFKIPDIPLITEADISWFREDEKGNYWFSSKEKDGHMYRYDQKEIKTYKIGYPVFTFSELPDGKLIAFTLFGFSTIDPVSGMVSNLDIGSKPPNQYFSRFLRLRDKSLLISTHQGIYRIDNSMRMSIVFPFVKDVFQGEVISMYEEDNGDIWIGKHDGARCIKKGQFNPEKADHFLDGNLITSILKDHENNYWFTSRNGAFNMRSKTTRTFTTQNGLNINEVSFVTRARDSLYVFLSNGFIYSLSANGKLKNLDYGAEKFQPATLLRIYKRPDGKIRALTGKYELLLDRAKVEFITTDYSDLWFNDGKQEWFVDEYGIGKITPEGRKHVHYNTAIMNFSYMNSICVDKQQNAWVGTKYGLYIFNGKEMVDKKKEKPLFGKSIVEMKRDSEGNIWVATKGNGIYTVCDNEIINYTIKDGLLTDYCNSIMIDSDNNIWISGNYGLNKLVLDSNRRIREIKVFNKSNSLLSNEVKSTYKEGRMIYVCTTQGLTVLDETNIQPSSVPPPVYITRLVIGSRDTTLQNFYDLDYGTGSMQINYTGISFSPDKNINYRYKMLPVDTGWKYTTLASLEYSSLPPGDYQFLVCAQNSDGVWSKAPAALQFHIKTPYWQSWWFRSLVVVSLSFIVLLIFYLRLQSSKNKSAQKRRLIEAELQSLRSQMNPHFIFNALNAIQDFVLNNDKENANIYLSKFAGLIRVIMENSKKPFISLNDEIKFLNLYLEIESVRFNHKFSYTIDIDTKIDRDKTRLPSMILQPYIENSIKHGLAPKKGKGSLLVQIRSERSQLTCIIEDDGIGRKTSAGAKRAGSNHISRGMETTHERLRLLNQSADLNMNLEIVDLKNAEGEACGTRVLLTFPTEFDS
jgi:ligand-binding sensor domain-containing protein